MPFFSRAKPLSLAARTRLLTGCAASMHTPYQTPAVNMPGGWRQETKEMPSSQGCWWEGFGDPVLNRLVEEALRKNNDLAAAALVVRRAQLQAEQADSDRLPAVSVQGSSSNHLGSGQSQQH